MDEQPGRIRSDKSSAGKLPMREPEYPELTKLRAFDRQQHMQRSIEAGMTREEAERHADEHLGERNDTRP